MKNCIIIHGAAFYDKENLAEGQPPQNERSWLPWIKFKLKQRGIKIDIPLMPRNWHPDYNDWKREFEKLLINEKSVLIGHSAGGAFLVRWLGETKQKIRKLILIAPAKICPDFYEDYFKEFYNFDIDKEIKDRVEDIVLFTSDNDSENILESSRLYSKIFNINPIVIKGAGHFIEKHMGTTEFPELLEEILNN